MAKNYITSTMSADVAYPIYVESSLATDEKNQKGRPAVSLGKIVIEGRANVASLTVAAGKIVTPEGVQTIVEDDVLEQLRKNKVFVKHEQNGFIKVTKAQASIEKLVKDMTAKDGSAQPTEAEMKKRGKKVSTGNSESAE